MANYVYTMNRVGKIVPPKRQILKDISLSFFPGANGTTYRIAVLILSITNCQGLIVAPNTAGEARSIWIRPELVAPTPA